MTERATSFDFMSSWRTYALFGGLMLGVGAPRWFDSWQPFLVLLGMFGIIAASMLCRRVTDDVHRRAIRLLSAGSLALLALAVVSAYELWNESGWPVGLRLAIVGVASVPIIVDVRSPRAFVVLRTTLIALVLIGGVLLVADVQDVYTDVRLGHIFGSESILSGGNPYSDIEFPDSAPEQWNQGTIVGYSYPPVTLVVYSVAERVWDSRLASVLAFVAVVVVLSARTRRFGTAGLAIAGIVISLPVTATVIEYAWTEPLQALLLILATIYWRRPVLFGVVLGLAVASKQYMILALIPLLSAPVPDKWKRVWLALLVAVATLLPFFLWNPIAMWNALVGHQLDRPLRGDSNSIAAFGVVAPIVVIAVVATLFGLIAGRFAATPSRLLLAQAGTMGLYFFLTPNSFANYWYLIATLVIASVVVGSDHGYAPKASRGAARDSGVAVDAHSP